MRQKVNDVLVPAKLAATKRSFFAQNEISCSAKHLLSKDRTIRDAFQKLMG
jgi:hypothetical protein